VIDPYEVAGIGTEPHIAISDLGLIDQCDELLAYLPVEGTQTGMEIMYALSQGKAVRVMTTNPDVPFFNWLRTKGVEVITIPKRVYCWKCGVEFDEGSYCPQCTTFICPQGHCFCHLSEETQRAIDNAMRSYFIWRGNPRKKKRTPLVDFLYAEFKAHGIVETYEEMLARLDELRTSYPHIYAAAVDKWLKFR